MCALGWREGGAGWQLRRQLWGWEEEMLEECTSVLYDIVLQTNISDSWTWRHDIVGGYSVRGAYSIHIARDDGPTTGVSDLIWHKHVPFKVSVLAWRLLRNRLPTKDNLVARNIIPFDARFCVNGCGELETVNHVFLASPGISPLWGKVRSWLGGIPVAAELVQDHFAHFMVSSGQSLKRLDSEKQEASEPLKKSSDAKERNMS
ncbi:hypothetical protein TSUD_415340 [Trifolium subterraneum]|uniref:Reverse transcriptase zinc-binding domain-containing protein n=1 Tax=Trifolium subterraneum TaxID=3900 RepID=A0A2Z6PJH0_TRISU|nr:hypothetical protein TSUD_415340 [Trifolium subterraneum]